MNNVLMVVITVLGVWLVISVIFGILIARWFVAQRRCDDIVGVRHLRQSRDA
jgi:hypothetical protein